MSCPLHDWKLAGFFYTPSQLFHNQEFVCSHCGRMKRKFYIGQGEERRIIELEVPTENVQIEAPN